VLHADAAWPVAEDADATAYVDAIRQVLADPSAARMRAADLRNRLLRERDEQTFANDAVGLLLRSFYANGSTS
jgi:hypothetical protein